LTRRDTGPALQHVILCGLQDVEAGGACEPFGLKDHRHAVVQLAHELVGL
jgi:hypothetical protein